MIRLGLCVNKREIEVLAVKLGASVSPQEIADLDHLIASCATCGEGVPENLDLFRRPDRVALSHIFLSRDSRQEHLRADAEALGLRLEAEKISPDQANEWGDPFLLSHRIALSSEESIGRQYGPEFAAAAIRAPLGHWSGPIPSSDGAHWVWAHERSLAEVPPLAEIRTRVENELLRERERAAMVDHAARLRENAEIIVLGQTP